MKIERKYPGIKEVIQQVSEKAPANFVDDLIDEVAEKKLQESKIFEVPYDWLTIKTDAEEINGEAVHFLFDEK